MPAINYLRSVWVKRLPQTHHPFPRLFSQSTCSIYGIVAFAILGRFPLPKPKHFLTSPQSQPPTPPVNAPAVLTACQWAHQLICLHQDGQSCLPPLSLPWFLIGGSCKQNFSTPNIDLNWPIYQKDRGGKAATLFMSAQEQDQDHRVDAGRVEKRVTPQH